eukprot:g1103.t1
MASVTLEAPLDSLWEKMIQPATNRIFFFHKKTKTAVWADTFGDHHPHAGGIDDWEFHKDGASGVPFLYSSSRKLSLWAWKPQFVDEDGIPHPTSENDRDERNGVVKRDSKRKEMDDSIRGKTTGNKHYTEAELSAVTDWQPHVHHSSKLTYYYSKTLDKSVWKLPNSSSAAAALERMRLDWTVEIGDLLNNHCHDDELQVAMQRWSVDKIVFWARKWKPERTCRILLGWDPKIIADVLCHASMPQEAAVHCMQKWKEEISKEVFAFCDVPTISEVLTVCYDEEQVWNDVQAAHMLDHMDHGKVRKVLQQWPGHEAAFIAQHFGGKFIEDLTKEVPFDETSDLMHDEESFKVWADDLRRGIENVKRHHQVEWNKNEEALGFSLTDGYHEREANADAANRDFDLKLKEAFDAWDIDKNGYLTPDEVKSIISQIGSALSDADLADVMHVADANADGKIELSEFKLMMRAVHEHLHSSNIISKHLHARGSSNRYNLPTTSDDDSSTS